MQKLSVIIPAYNEEQRISGTVREISQYLQKQAYSYEVIIINDGAKDNTSNVVRSLQAELPNIQLIDNLINHGKGYVVKQGMLLSTGDRCLFMDADNSTSIDQIERFLPVMDQGFDIVIGSIAAEGAKVSEAAQWYRRLFGYLSSILIRLLAGLWGIRDTQRGFKLFTGKAAHEVFSRSIIERFGFDFEILSIAKQHGFSIKEVPIVWNNSAGSTVGLGSYLASMWDLLKVRWNLWRGFYT